MPPCGPGCRPSLERMERPPCNEKPLMVGKVLNGAETYTYFICYKHGKAIGNTVVVMGKPIKGIEDIREIEYALVGKDVALKPTILNFVSF